MKNSKYGWAPILFCIASTILSISGILFFLYVISTTITSSEERFEKDLKLAQNLDGDWHRSYTYPLENGQEATIDVYWRFRKATNENCGLFFEVIYAQQPLLEYGNDYWMCKWTSRIKGGWRLDTQKLRTKYDDPNNIKVGLERANHSIPLVPEVFFNDELWPKVFSDATEDSFIELKSSIFENQKNWYQEMNGEDDEGIPIEISQNALNLLSFDGSNLVSYERVEKSRQ